MSSMPLAELARAFLLWAVMPVWMAAGFADWLCHRRSRIETTSGLPEAGLHVLMLAELGLPTLAAVFFEINALVVALMLVGFLLHELTIYIDLRYSSARRDIPPVEQMVHSFLELVPVVAATLLFLLHWPAVLSLFGLGDAPADFSLRWKPPPLPPVGLGLFAGLLLLFVVLPYGEELWRCARARQQIGGAGGPN